MATVTPTTAVLGSHHQGRWYQHLYVQVLTAILLGVLLNYLDVATGMIRLSRPAEAAAWLS